jgi:hypothetical protein
MGFAVIIPLLGGLVVFSGLAAVFTAKKPDWEHPWIWWFFGWMIGLPMAFVGFVLATMVSSGPASDWVFSWI